MSVGQAGESLVAKHYQNLGFTLLARNYIFPEGKQMGEIDLIVIKGQDLVFVEVKTRRNEKFGTGLEAVDIFKQRKLVKTTKLFLRQNPKYQAFNYRIDVATVDLDNPVQPVIIISNAIEDLD
ncbi:MAG TPA: YraN family protein [Methylomirabilota bacterium]|jgi:putative endonuclease|nr:YraN family protein [Methylomirabilota bacterium]